MTLRLNRVEAFAGESVLIKDKKPKLSQATLELLELNPARIEAISQWLSFSLDQRDLEDHLADLALYPESIPLSRNLLELVMAVLREEIRAEATEPAGEAQRALVITDQLLARLPHQGLAILTVMDALQPQGALPLLYQAAEKEILLGTLVAFNNVQDRGIAAKIKIRRAPEEVTYLELPVGELVLLPLGEEAVELEVVCENAVLAEKKKALVDVIGGEVGVILDARGRPLKLGLETAARQAKLERWLEVFL